MRIWRPVALFALLTVVMTWPQAAHLATHAADHQDVFFNMWRFGWFAHALATSPSHLLDGNIFYPEARTLTFSDAMPVESLLAAPMLWAGVPPVLVHNLMLLGAIVLSGAGACVLARRVTGSAAAGVTAGIVFAFAPYRFEHFMHMELQWTVWTPWAFWALDRTLETGRRRYGLLTGACVALQMLSSVYYGIFLGVVLGLCAVLLLVTQRQRVRTAFAALAIGGVMAAAVSAAYSVPYLRTKTETGGRGESEILRFSAKPSSYLVATDTNYLYGARSQSRGRPERRLFPGILPCLLAVFGLLAVRPTRHVAAYLVALAVAFEMSLGLYGHSYGFLYEHVPLFEGLRAPARLGIYVVFFLGLLAAHGHAALEAVIPPLARRVVAVLIPLLLLVEYWVVPIPLLAYVNTPPPLYRWLAQQPRGVVLELPIPQPDSLPGDDARYGYMSTFHWMPLANGYSGFYPPSYLARLVALAHIPDETSAQRIRADGVRYLIVHPASYENGLGGDVLARISASPHFTQLGVFFDGRADAAVFAVR
ncbi:MAG TPA: hypothetical protein VF147_05510 [Vicinamibacterales bacterium]